MRSIELCGEVSSRRRRARIGYHSKLPAGGILADDQTRAVIARRNARSTQVTFIDHGVLHLADIRVAQVPEEPVAPRPDTGNRVSGVIRQAVGDCLAGHDRIRSGLRGIGGFGCHEAADHRALRIEELHRDRCAARRCFLQPIVHQRTRRWILAGRAVAPPAGTIPQHRRRRLEEMHRLGSHLVSEFTQRREVINHPERTPMCCRDQVIAVHVQIAHAHTRQVQLQRLPIRTVIHADPDTVLGTGVQQTAAHGIFTHHTRERGTRNTGDDLRPCFAVVGRLPEVRREVVLLVPVGRDIHHRRIVR